MIGADAVGSDAQAVKGCLYGGGCLGMPAAVKLESPHGRPAEVGLSRDPATGKIAADQSAADISDSTAHGRGLVHAANATAHQSEQSSAHKTGRAQLRLIAQTALMKMSTSEIMRELHAYTGWSWRAIADFLRVSPNTPQNWLKGNGARGDNLLKAAKELRLTADQLLGRADIPKGFLDHIDKTKAPRPSRCNKEVLYTQSEVDAIVKSALASRGIH